MTKRSSRKLRVAYTNVYRKILNLHMRCSDSQKLVDNGQIKTEALIRTLLLIGYEPAGLTVHPPPPE